MQGSLSGLQTQLVTPSSETAEVILNPKPGFCVKTVAVDDNGSYSSPSSSSATRQAEKRTNELLEPSSSSTSFITIAGPSSSAKPFDAHTNASKIRIPKGTKLFLNIAWDTLVPPPPPCSEATIRRAMAGDDLDLDVAIGEEKDGGEGAYYVPIVVSDPREVIDKKGSPSLVVDCVLNSKLKERSKKDREFRVYLIELALENVEEKTGCTLSREVGTPNIAAKGTLEPRTVLMPRSFIDPPSSSSKDDSRTKSEGSGTSGMPNSRLTNEKPRSILKKVSTTLEIGSESYGRAPSQISNTSATPAGGGAKRPLIEELPSDDNLRLDNASASVAAVSSNANVARAERESAPVISVEDTFEPKNVSVKEMGRRMRLPPLKWTWAQEGSRINISIDATSLTRALHARTTLDVEPQRLHLHVPDTAFLSIDLTLSDSLIGRISSLDVSADAEGGKREVEVLKVRGLNAGETLRLKRLERQFDVEGARAEWRIIEEKLVLLV